MKFARDVERLVYMEEVLEGLSCDDKGHLGKVVMD